MEIVPFNFLRIAKRRKSVVGRTWGARASSMIRAVDEDQLFISALGMVVNDFTNYNEVVAAML